MSIFCTVETQMIIKGVRIYVQIHQKFSIPRVVVLKSADSPYLWLSWCYQPSYSQCTDFFSVLLLKIFYFIDLLMEKTFTVFIGMKYLLTWQRQPLSFLAANLFSYRSAKGRDGKKKIQPMNESVFSAQRSIWWIDLCFKSRQRI